jgi:NADP-reducing hydrogenase subunit HndC
MQKLLNSSEDLEQVRRVLLAITDLKKPTIVLCGATGCETLGAKEVVKAFKEEFKKRNLEEKIDIKETGCLGSCERGPRVTIQPEEIAYFRVKPSDVPEIVERTILNKEIIERLLYIDPATGVPARYLYEVPFYKYQNRLLLDRNAKIDPKNIEDYIKVNGYKALSKVLFQMTPDQVIEELKESGLRGRGGGGFPTWMKWDSARKALETTKYVIVNGNESNPGSFMNRVLMEGNPNLILEGLIIGAFVVGSHEGYFYIRQDCPLALENIQAAIDQATAFGLLGKDILGSGFDFEVKIFRSAGGYISGESSALIQAIEGTAGEPRPKYIHNSERGLWGKPTVVDNVETWANVPLIMNNTAEWFKEIGSEGCRGTKIFALAGKSNNTGLVEVPLGITMRDLIFKIGGGIRDGKKFKAVQIGGPSGGMIPEQYLDVPIAFDELEKLGAKIGSGGIIVMDNDTCMVDAARYFVNFLCKESCGKCVPCREGLLQAKEILDRIVSGKGEEGDIKKLHQIAESCGSSLCALGKTAANPMLTSLRYFAYEYDEHIKGKRCPALSCKPLINFYIDPAKCNACTLCARNCPVKAIDGAVGKIHIIDQSKCVKCGTCFDACRFKAVTKISGKPVPPPIPEEQRLKKPVKKEN